jgi:outer membrane protein W
MKTFCIFLTLIFFYVQANGQSARPDRQWRLGVLVGRPVAGKIYDDAKMKSASGLVAGLDLGYYFEKRESGPSLHFHPSFITFKKTETDGEKTGPYYVESKWKWEAIHLPLSFRYTLPTGVVRPFVEFGLNFRFRTALFFRKSGTICGIVSCNAVGGGQSIQNVANKDKLGILAGVGVEVDAGKVTIPLSIRLVDSILQPKGSDDQAL